MKTLVLGDRVQLEQVLLNLIMNARDSLDGVPVASRRLRVEIVRIGGKAQLSVIDSGIGIPRENLRLVFESFYTTKAKGLGLGLPICQAIVTDHGGRLWIESDAHGATLYMTLPLMAPEAGNVFAVATTTSSCFGRPRGIADDGFALALWPIGAPAFPGKNEAA